MRLALAGCIGIFLVGCGDRTAILLSVDSDLEPGVGVTEVAVGLWIEGAELWSARYPVEEGAEFPTTYRILPTSRGAETVDLSVAAERRGRSVVSATRRASFVHGQEIEVLLCLWGRCEALDSESCRAGRCEADADADGDADRVFDDAPEGDADLDDASGGGADSSADGGAADGGEAGADADTHGPGDADFDTTTSALPDRYLTAVDRFARDLCACEDWRSYTFVSESACVSFYRPHLECFAEVYAGWESYARAAYECQASVYEEAIVCLEESRCAEILIEPCADLSDRLYGECPENPVEDAFAREMRDCIVGPPSGCPDDDSNPTTLGDAVFYGTLEYGGDDFSGSCSPATGAADRSHLWTAPSSDTFVIDTIGSDVDINIHALTECAGEELGCSEGDMGWNRLQLDLAAGQSIVIVLDGARYTMAGPYVVNIRSF